MLKKQVAKKNSFTSYFWCPPLAGKALPLVTSTLSATIQLNSAEMAAAINAHKLSHTEQQRAEQFIKNWPEWQVSAYNAYRAANHCISTANPYIVVVYQQVNPPILLSLLAAASAYCLAHKIPTILVVSDCANSLITDKDFTVLNNLANKVLAPGIALQRLSKPCHHANILAKANAVIAVDSWLGFEALLWQKPVITLGKPFYAGLSLTQDIQQPSKTYHVALTQLVHYVLLANSQSFCPETKEPQSIEQALSWLQQQNQLRNRFPEKLYAIGFTFWWKNAVKAFFQGSEVVFVKQPQQVPHNTTAVIWGRKSIAGLASTVKLYRLEDGFLRSVGLGALFAKPLSWVADSAGLYFDATKASDLENLLNTRAFTNEQLHQAQQLIPWLCEHNVTKYNTGQANWHKPDTNEKVLLVVGQVEADASIAYGASEIKHNLALLKAVRQRNPNAYIVYKPHPDVVAGARAIGQNEQQTAQFCNQVVEHADISAMLQQVDEVHVITSLAGFEALLRGKPVYCYGLPFYAGWGLTTDITTCARRSQKLTLTELVAGTLLTYPLYLGFNAGYYSNALETAQALAKIRQHNNQQPLVWQKLLRLIINSIRGKE